MTEQPPSSAQSSRTFTSDIQLTPVDVRPIKNARVIIVLAKIDWPIVRTIQSIGGRSNEHALFQDAKMLIRGEGGITALVYILYDNFLNNQ